MKKLLLLLSSFCITLLFAIHCFPENTSYRVTTKPTGAHIYNLGGKLIQLLVNKDYEEYFRSDKYFSQIPKNKDKGPVYLNKDNKSFEIALIIEENAAIGDEYTIQVIKLDNEIQGDFVVYDKCKVSDKFKLIKGTESNIWILVKILNPNETFADETSFITMNFNGDIPFRKKLQITVIVTKTKSKK